jgi:putative dehydrogenase
MKPLVAIVAPGSMGAAVARRLTENNLRILTTLAGRSAESEKRALAAGMSPVPPERLVEADFVLSIVPPGVALRFAEEMVPHLKAAKRKPIFVDCNAVSPATVKRIHATIKPTGAPFIDAGIIGGPPQQGYDGPYFYASGDQAAKFQTLSQYGLVIRTLDAPIGAASALKMAYAGITKGCIAVVTGMILAAERAGCGEVLRKQLSETEATLLNSMSFRVPAMFPKAYRWVAEMQEIAQFASEDPATAKIYLGASDLYDRMAQDLSGDKHETTALTDFFKRTSS